MLIGRAHFNAHPDKQVIKSRFVHMRIGVAHNLSYVNVHTAAWY